MSTLDFGVSFKIFLKATPVLEAGRDSNKGLSCADVFIQIKAAAMQRIKLLLFISKREFISRDAATHSQLGLSFGPAVLLNIEKGP